MSDDIVSKREARHLRKQYQVDALLNLLRLGIRKIRICVNGKVVREIEA